MQNLAGDKNCDEQIENELRRCGIEAVSVERSSRNEVPYSVMGKLGNFVFTRQWYYWAVEGNVPLSVAQELYADPVGKTDIRVNGDAGRTPPEGRGLTYLNGEGNRLFPLSEKPNSLEYVDKDIRFVENPSAEGQAFVTSYHIDSEIGLRLFADTLKRHSLV